MPILAKPVSSTFLASGDCLTLVNEASTFTVPPFQFLTPESPIPYGVSDDLVPLGSRVAFSTTTSELNSKRQLVPVLVSYRGTFKGVQPYRLYPLQNALDITIKMDPTTEFFHLHWWWNAWSPDWSIGFSELEDNTPISSPPSSPPAGGLGGDDRYRTVSLPRPPIYHYHHHTVPDLDNPKFLMSLAPRTLPGPFDPRRPFWVAPVAEGYFYDALAGWPDSITPSLDPAGPRLPDTPGARLFLSMLQRGVVEYPRKNGETLTQALDFDPDLSPEGDYSDWVLRGGVVGARKHIEIESGRDTPEFVSESKTGELQAFPDDGAIPQACTVEDHAVIIRALKAHIDHRAVSNASRVLMHARGKLIRGKFKPKTTQLKPPVGKPFGTSWPSVEQEGETVPVLVLDHPTPVFWNTLTNNYRMMVNEDKVLYRELDYPDFTFNNSVSTLLNMGSTAHRDHDPQVDFILSDPHDFYRPEIYGKTLDRGTL